jgi:RNA polymerase sigma-70 factor (ECF subfamily)
VSSISDRDGNASIFSKLQEGRRQFLALVENVRPELHRYCARMTGSIAEGEDIVQDTLAHAYYELAELKELPAMRSWLFRIAHNRALDYLRRYDRRMGEPLDDAFDIVDDDALNPEDALAHDQAVRAAVSRFLELVPAQRSCVILKDVLDYSLDEIAALLDLSVPAVKAVLHRGRERLRELCETPTPATPPRPVSPALARYAALFNARDWDGVRAMLAEDVRLDLVSREQRAGREQVSHYFTNYAAVSDWHLVPALLDSREVIAVFRNPHDRQPGYFIELGLIDGRIAAIRDFRYVPYIARDAVIEPTPAGE